MQDFCQPALSVQKTLQRLLHWSGVQHVLQGKLASRFEHYSPSAVLSHGGSQEWSYFQKRKRFLPCSKCLKLKDWYNLFEFHVLCLRQVTNKLLQRCCLLLMTLWIKIQWFAPWCSNFFWSTGEILSSYKSQGQPSGFVKGLWNSFCPTALTRWRNTCSSICPQLNKATSWRRQTKLNFTYCTPTAWRYMWILSSLDTWYMQQFLCLKLYICFLYFKDSMYERVQFRTIPERQVFLQEETAFLVCYEQSQSAETTTVEFLQQVARVRMDLDLAALLVVENRKNAGLDFLGTYRAT